MKQPLTSQIEIDVVPPDQRIAALWLVFGWELERNRRDRLATCMQSMRTNPKAFQFLLEARQNNALIGAIWGEVAPGRVANVWPPVLVKGSPDGIADSLVDALDARLASTNVVCGQSLLPIFAESAAAPLLRRGYSLATRLLFLASFEAQMPLHEPSSELDFEPFKMDQKARMTKLIDETYVQSLDAPILDGVRSTNDVVEGYQLTGEFSPERWFFVRHQNRDLGCLLLTEHSQTAEWELIYMGLIPEARGLGWGVKIARHAQWLTRRAGRTVLLLGVDEANHPAISTYARCGFIELDRRIVLLKSFSATM